VKRKRTIIIAPTIDSPKPCRVQWITEQARRLHLTGDVGGELVIVAPSIARMPANPSTIEVKVPSSRASEFARESWLWEEMARLGLKAADVEKPVDTAPRGLQFAIGGAARNKPEKSKSYEDRPPAKTANEIKELASSAPVGGER
jgi:hypothetical protein